MTTKPRLLTGDRPTGRLHLGHYVGSLKNRVRLQHQYESFFIIADLHTLTTKPEPESIKEIPTFIKEIVLDYLAVGIDPDVSTIFVQSAIPETYQLNLLLISLLVLIHSFLAYLGILQLPLYHQIIVQALEQTYLNQIDKDFQAMFDCVQL